MEYSISDSYKHHNQKKRLIQNKVNNIVGVSFYWSYNFQVQNAINNFAGKTT